MHTWTMTLSQPPDELEPPVPAPGRERRGGGGGLWSPGRRGLTVGLVLTVTLVAFEALAVSTVMPIVARELRGLELYGWVFTAFMLGSLIGIVLVGGLIDRRGLGAPFAAGIGLFAVGLIVGGLAPSMEVLVAARFLQGLGAGTVPPIAYVAIGRSLPEHLRPQMFATLSTAWVLPGVLGPALAGIIGEAVGWRWVFLGLLPLIVVSSAIAFPAVRRIGPDPSDAANAATLRQRGPLAVLVALGTGLLLAGLTSGQPLQLALLGSLGTALAVFALRRLTPAGTLRAARGLPAAVLMRGIITFAFFAVDAYVALALVEWRGLGRRRSRDRADRRDDQLDGGLVDPGTVLLALGPGALRPGRPDRARGRTRLLHDRPAARRLAVAGHPDARAGRATRWAWPTRRSRSSSCARRRPPNRAARRRRSRSRTRLGTALGTGITGALVAASVRDIGDPSRGLAIGFAVAVGIGVPRRRDRWSTARSDRGRARQQRGRPIRLVMRGSCRRLR